MELSYSSLSSVVSWRNIAILFALLNLKNLPLVWHLQLFYQLFRNRSGRARVRQTLGQHTGSTHPIFAPVSIFSRSPLLETDYNLHKSNSTYFSDLDIARSAVVSTLLSPGHRTLIAELDKEGQRGPLNVLLGSVHTSFTKEIGPYEAYEVRSRVLGWDRKWLLIGSWFIRPAKKGKQEVLFASALSKYVIKKGRLTIHPERAFQAAGWLPPKPEGSESLAATPSPAKGLFDSAIQLEPAAPTLKNRRVVPEASTPDTVSSVASGSDLIVAPIPEDPVKLASTVETLENAARGQPNGASSRVEETGKTSPREWQWSEIEQERKRGLELAQGWLSLDDALKGEHQQSTT